MRALLALGAPVSAAGACLALTIPYPGPVLLPLAHPRSACWLCCAVAALVQEADPVPDQVCLDQAARRPEQQWAARGHSVRYCCPDLPGLAALGATWALRPAVLLVWEAVSVEPAENLSVRLLQAHRCMDCSARVSSETLQRSAQALLRLCTHACMVSLRVWSLMTWHCGTGPATKR